VLGSNSSACPSGFFPLDYEKACQHAAEQLVPKKPYRGSLSDDLKAAYMSGCYWHTVDGSVYFNDKPASDASRVDSFALQLCAGAPSPAPRYAPHAAELAPDRAHKGCVHDVCGEVCDAPCAAVCMPVSERASLHACVHLGLQTIHIHLPHPFIHRCIHPAVHLGLSVLPSFDPEIRPPTLRSALPFLACIPPGCDGCALRNASAAPAAASAAAANPVANGNLPTPHFLTLSRNGPGHKGWQRGLVQSSSHMLPTPNLCAQGIIFLRAETSISAPLTILTCATRGSKRKGTVNLRQPLQKSHRRS
jgi:hypothetical protein